jgi:hypothetical protein
MGYLSYSHRLQNIDLYSPDKTEEKQTMAKFKPGQSGNPSGRPN